MKKSATLELLNGFKKLNGEIPAEITNKYGIITEAIKEFEAMLTDEQLKHFLKVEEMLVECQSEENEFFLAKGFKLGVLLGVECTEYAE